MDVGLAVTGLAAQLFVSVVQSYAFLRTAQGLARDAPISYWKLRIEEIRLQSWGRYWSIGRGTFSSTQLLEVDVEDDIAGILRQMHDLLKDSARLQKRYGLSTEAFAPEIKVWENEDGNTVEKEDGERDGSEKKMTPATKWRAKFRWALTDKTQFSTLIDDLRALNDGLYSLLRVNELRTLEQGLQSSVLRATADNTNAVADLANACAENEKQMISTTTTALARQQAATYHDLVRAASSKQTAMAQAAQVVPPAGTSAPPHTLTPSTLLIADAATVVAGYPRRTPSSMRVLAEYANTTVLLEWKDVVASDGDNKHSQLVAQRIEHLARLLAVDAPKAADFRVLDCLGYFADDDRERSRYGYVFALPPGSAARPPASLLQLLARTGPNARLPDLGDRFRIAQALAAALLRLHDCGWIHTAFRSDAVLFFFCEDEGGAGGGYGDDVEEEGGDKLALHAPYIAGFGYSKPADPAASTLEFSRPSAAHDLYRHPEIVRRRRNTHNVSTVRHAQRHDLYSLAIVLLEIGLWEQIQMTWKAKYSLDEFRDKLLRVYVPKLGHKMGAAYRDVVRDLLTRHLGEDGGGDGCGSGDGDGERGDEDDGDGDGDGRGEGRGEGRHDGTGGELDWWSIVVRLQQCRA